MFRAGLAALPNRDSHVMIAREQTVIDKGSIFASSAGLGLKYGLFVLSKTFVVGHHAVK